MSNGLLRKRIVTALGAALYALFAAFGFQAQGHGPVDIPHALLVAAALFIPAYALLALLLRKSSRTASADAKPFHASKAFLFIFACYVPVFLVAYPGSFAYDVPFQLRQVFTGEYSTHHPLLHTLLMGGCVKLGQAVGSINLGAALYTVIQMAALAGCFAAACASIARSCSKKAARRSALFFALYPLHMFMAVNATKDVPFSGLFALTLALAFEMVKAPSAAAAADLQLRLRRFTCLYPPQAAAGSTSPEGGAMESYLPLQGEGDRVSGGRGFALVLCGAGMMLLRNNALYAVIVWLPLLCFLKKRGIALIACMLAAVVGFTAANGAMKTTTGAVDSDLVEMLSIPVQQLARARNMAGDRLTDEEREAIDRIMPQNSWQLYDATISDPVKFEFDTAEFKRDTGKYTGVYLSVGKKCMDVYTDALLAHTVAFWYPYREYKVSGYYLQMGVNAEQTESWCDFDWISQTSPLRRVLESLSWRFGAQGAMQYPVIGYLFNMGAIIWVMFFFVLREMHAGRWGRFAVCLLPVLLWGTFLLGPVMAGRYVYPFVCSLPVLASRPRGGA